MNNPLATRRRTHACWRLALRAGEARMHANPKFWALFGAIWVGMVLAVMNIAVKVHMFMDLADQQ